MDKKDFQNLQKRYLIWLYKTTKEAIDKIERKFSQLEIDGLILGELKKAKGKTIISNFISDFEAYIQQKENSGLSLKFEGNKLKPEYQFLALKLIAIEKVISRKFGKSSLSAIKSSYEKEMTRRILEERQQKV